MAVKTETDKIFLIGTPDEKNRLDEVLRRGRGERDGLNWRNRWNGRDLGGLCGCVEQGFSPTARSILEAAF